MTAMTLAETRDFLDREFPQMQAGGRAYCLEAVGPLTARMRLDGDARFLRPGGTLSGPSMMALADYALYAAILAQIGPVALAVTTSLTFNFLRKPAGLVLIADVTLLKLGRRLAVGEVRITAPGSDDLVAQANGTYSIPPR
ncbi:PaaI family thioesterase [Methylobacterium sp. E-041]|jgi:acyl-coenzyme A thioesterase PaaI-like protein|uniref:PaaI family thioesterase n=1 Tax=Methylobacterium sp. E-041 TaxID=2836573 RepID=UPI001FBB98BC|nr:PaaI family thioesterase [Methylobacterium sp. E-041]MCJ2104241.1 PaaI family thioesterase [Methylobacterium sp. E-041]